MEKDLQWGIIQQQEQPFLLYSLIDKLALSQTIDVYPYEAVYLAIYSLR
jgi:hypothetical protein